MIEREPKTPLHPEKIEPSPNPEYPREFFPEEIELFAELKKLESKLPPEAIEKVMGRVGDIEEPGLGKHVLDAMTKDGFDRTLDKLGSILTSGITPKGGRWPSSGVVCFNVMGAMGNEDIYCQKEEKYGVLSAARLMSPGSVEIMFDLSQNQKDRLGLWPEVKTTGVAKEKKRPPTIGYEFSEGILPEQFKGIVIWPYEEVGIRASIYCPEFSGKKEEASNEAIKSIRSIFNNSTSSIFGYPSQRFKERLKKFGESEELVEGMDKKYKEYPGEMEVVGTRDGTLLKIQAAKTAKTMLESIEHNKQDPNKYLIPIYDVYGDLLWPESISYEELKKVVKERK